MSPGLSNILLTDLDRELEGRGHRFRRHADDGNLYVKSEAAGQHAMAAITGYLERKLTPGQPGQERCRPALAAEVSGLQRHLAQTGPCEDCRQQSEATKRPGT